MSFNAYFRTTLMRMTISEPLDRLPKVSYAVLKDRQIRELLQEEKLSTNGDRSTLESRHARYYHVSLRYAEFCS